MMPVPPPPAKNCELPYGTVLKAGPGEATVIADMDFETYSEAGFVYDPKGEWKSAGRGAVKGLSLVGARVYAEHPSTEVLCFAYDLKDGKGRRLWVPGQPNPEDLFTHLAEGRLVEAWNVAFEQAIWHGVCERRYGWPPLNPRVLRCAMAKSRAYCLPGALDKAAKALNLNAEKDRRGKALLNKFSIPRNPTGKDRRLRLLPLEETDGYDLFQYCLKDIEVEAEVSTRVPDLSAFELKYWQMSQDCNWRGVRIDTRALKNALEFMEAAYEKAKQECCAVTHGCVNDTSEVQKIKDWLATAGVHTHSLDAEAVETLLLRADLPENARRILELRKKMGSASVKKLYAMKHQLTRKGRVHDMFVYHSARTGRDAGAGIQPQNMPRDAPDCRKCECGVFFQEHVPECPRCGADSWMAGREEWGPDAADFTLRKIADGEADRFFPDLLAVLPGCIRGFLIADEGHDFIGSDYTAIEAVVSACLSGCQWRIEAFRNKEDIYLASVSAITGIPVEEYKRWAQENGKHHADRKKGKVAELASGFGGWTGAWKNFGADDFFDSEEDLVEAIKAWRNASPEIVDAWGGQLRYGRTHLYGLEGAFLNSLYSDGQVIETGLPGVSYENRGGTVYCRLPSGRRITYHNASARQDYDRPGKMALYFYGYNTNPVMGPVGWIEMNTYGGKLFENVVQAVARDIMANAAVNLHAAGYPVALRVHDEIVCHVPEGAGSIEHFESIANSLPEWARSWPVSVSGGWRGKRFRK